jgi:transposase-like protein
VKQKHDKKAHGVRYTEESKRMGVRMLKKKGATVQAVAEELGISARTLRRWAKEAGVERPGQQRQFDREKIMTLLGNNKTTAEVAAKLGCSARHVRAVRNGSVGA